jgi:protein-disulfide isomerase
MDFACPHCQTYRTVIDQVVVDYVANGMAKYEIRIFPTAGGLVTYYLGQVLECAEEQRAGTFWDGYELLYEYAATNRYNEKAGRLLANQFDLNYAKMQRCTANAQQVMNDIVLAESLGVTGTPGIRVRYDDGEAVPVTMDGVELTRGGVAFEVLVEYIQVANGIELTPEPSGEML